MAKRKLPQELEDEVCARREKGHSYGQIISWLKHSHGIEISQGARQWRCLVNGADCPHPPRPQAVEVMVYRRGGHTVRRFSEAEDALLLALRAKNVSYAEIGRRLNRGHSAILGLPLVLARRDDRLEAAA